MKNSEHTAKLLVWSAEGITTHLLYILIVFTLLNNSETTVDRGSLLETFLPLVALSIILSIFVIVKGLRQDKSANWGIIWLAIFHTPSIVGLALAFHMIAST